MVRMSDPNDNAFSRGAPSHRARAAAYQGGPRLAGDGAAAGMGAGAGAGTEAACAMGMAPNSIAPATALAPTAPAAIRRAEDSEIDIWLLLHHVWGLTLRNAKG